MKILCSYGKQLNVYVIVKADWYNMAKCLFDKYMHVGIIHILHPDSGGK